MEAQPPLHTNYPDTPPELRLQLVQAGTWGQDAQFLDTPGWSNRLSHDRGIIYAQSTARSSARFVRFIPDFVTRMKAAVKEANK